MNLQTALDCAIAAQLAYQVPDVETVRRSGLECLHVFAFDASRSQGVVIEQADRIIVAYRGTTYEDILTNAKLSMTQGPFLVSRVHRGFLSYASRPIAFIRDRLNECPAKPVIFTGHSLGGAAAVISAAVLRSQIRNQIQMSVTFGCPRIGDGDFAAISHYEIPHERWVHANDGVPRVPFAFRGYRHSGNLNYITGRGSIWHRPNPLLVGCDRLSRFFQGPFSWATGKILDHQMVGYTTALRDAVDLEGLR